MAAFRRPSGVSVRWRQLAAPAVYLAVVAFLVVEGRSEPLTSQGRSPDALSFVILAVASLALLLRHRAPLLVAGVAVASLVIWRDMLDYQGRAINIPFLVALYTVALTGTVRRTVFVGTGVSLIAVARTVIAGSGWIGATTSIGWTISALLFGEGMRARAEFASDADSRARRVEADREREVERRVTEERLRIARELHDVIAHTVSVMTVQTSVAADVLGDRPDEAREALATVRSASREANRELRALVGLLRSPDGEAELAPVPCLADIPELVRSTENAGIATELTWAGRRRALPSLVELTAYRVVQEALTNVVRHAEASRACVCLGFCERELLVEVADDGRAPVAANGTGFGLRGMAERVGSLGGRLEHGPRAPVGFEVRAHLPLDAGS